MKVGTAVIFRSMPAFFNKEKDGRKPNTCRRIDPADARFRILKEGCAQIIILNAETGEPFQREITDYSEFGEWAIISWRHE